jgi:hypothetical protein
MPTRFPHPSHLYRNLVSKEWTAHLCLTPDLHIPATTKISISTAVRDPYKAADAALKALYMIKRAQQSLQGGGEIDGTTAALSWLRLKRAMMVVV